MPAVSRQDLEALEFRFPQTHTSYLELFHWYYVIFDMTNPKKKKKTGFGYLVKIIKLDAKEIWFHHVQDSHMVSGGNEADEVYCSKFKADDDSLVIFAVHGLSYENPEQTKVLEDRGLNGPTLEEVKKDEKWESEGIKKLILEDRSIYKMKGLKEPRVDLLCKTILKIYGTIGSNATDFEALGEEEDLAKKFTPYVKEAMMAAKEAHQTVTALDNTEAGVAHLGLPSTNAQIVARTILRSLEEKDATTIPAGKHERREFEILTHRMDKLTQLVSLLSITHHRPTPEVPPSAPVGGVISMRGNGDCCYQVAGAATYLNANATLSLDKINEKHLKMVVDAKSNLVNNAVTMSKHMDATTKTDNTHFAASQWNELLGKTGEDIINYVLEGKGWGGVVELALSLWHTSTEIVVVLADSIHEKADAKQVEGAIHRAMLSGLPPGPESKTSRVFAILDSGHYYLGTTTTGGIKKAIFNITGEADVARDLIVAFLKTKRKGPLSELDEAERKATIDAALKTALTKPPVSGPAPPVPTTMKKPAMNNLRQNVSFAAAAGGQQTGAGGQNISVNVMSRRPEAEVPCRYFALGTCNFGTECRFKHEAQKRSNTMGPQASRRPEKRPITQGSQRRNRSPVHRGRSVERQSGFREPDTSGIQSKASSRPSSRSRSRQSRRDVNCDEHGQEVWQQVPTSKRIISVKCRKGIHPVSWRNSLKNIDKTAHELVTWVDTDPHDTERLLIACDKGNFVHLSKLLKNHFTVLLKSPQADGQQRPTARCAKFLSGERCEHPGSKCK